MEKWLTKRTAVAAIAVITLWKLYLSAALQLHPDEAYYWLWSQRLAFGYYDHAPLLAWLIRLTTIFSNAEIWVRFSGAAGTVVMSVLAWKLAREISGRTAVAAAAAIMLNVLPLTVSGSIIITPDIPAFFFWSLAVWWLWRAARSEKKHYWYLAGIAFGLSLLSKYTSVLFAPCAFLALAASPEDRRWLKTPHPYAAFVLGLLMFIPVILWNAQHDWISFRFQLGHGLGSDHYRLDTFLDYLGGQMLVAGPFVWLAGMVGGSTFLFARDRNKRFLAFTSLPVILFFAYSSLKKSAGPNWPACAYFTFCILTSWYLLDGKKLRRAFLAAAIGFSAFMSIVVTMHARYSILPLSQWNRDWAIADATNWFYGWRELTAKIMDGHPDTRFVLTPSHQLCAEIAYYSGGKLHPYIDLELTRPSQFNIWRFPAGLKDSEGVYVFIDGEAPGPYPRYFGELTGASGIDIIRSGFRFRGFHIIRGRGYLQPDKNLIQ